MFLCTTSVSRLIPLLPLLFSLGSIILDPTYASATPDFQVPGPILSTSVVQSFSIHSQTNGLKHSNYRCATSTCTSWKRVHMALVFSSFLLRVNFFLSNVPILSRGSRWYNCPCFSSNLNQWLFLCRQSDIVSQILLQLFCQFELTPYGICHISILSITLQRWRKTAVMSLTWFDNLLQSIPQNLTMLDGWQERQS